MADPRIPVLGAGPAGAATALACGASATPSRSSRTGAVSSRSRDLRAGAGGLRHAGLGRALGEAVSLAKRQVLWNGEHLRLNQEYLLDRPAFDRALRSDLLRAGVTVIEGRVRELLHEDGHRYGWKMARFCGPIFWWKPVAARHRWRLTDHAVRKPSACSTAGRVRPGTGIGGAEPGRRLGLDGTPG